MTKVKAAIKTHKLLLALIILILVGIIIGGSYWKNRKVDVLADVKVEFSDYNHQGRVQVTDKSKQEIMTKLIT
ncbi:hypothetical protein HU830_02775 [Lactobacillus sp. DCY120]|uniref:Uncharacterized protein n=1 Tax=Bombilactobacillus apium TaxID=2675299 RepID=A0A850RBD2_9LACO|nr:hypothetical protein [Bombilactobacillus apium]NVY96108.1 hypothetical protein [Bombilactobacillus apium]